MYSPYNPYGYLFPGQQMPQTGPQMTQTGIFPQQGVNLPAQQQTTQNAAPAVLQVATVKQVEQAPVQPGGKALVLVANEPVIAMRSADNMGLTTTDYYHIERFDPDSASAAPASDYVTHAEFQQTISQLLQQIQQTSPAAATDKEAKGK